MPHVRARERLRAIASAQTVANTPKDYCCDYQLCTAMHTFPAAYLRSFKTSRCQFNLTARACNCGASAGFSCLMRTDTNRVLVAKRLDVGHGRQCMRTRQRQDLRAADLAHYVPRAPRCLRTCADCPASGAARVSR